MVIREPSALLRKSVSQSSKIIEETEVTEQIRESANFRPEDTSAGSLGRQVGINSSYVNWLESRLVQKNKTASALGKKRDIIIRKKKNKTDSRNAYLNEIETQIKNMKNQNAK